MGHFIYIMTNPAMKDNLIKIGYSSDPERRRKDLSHQSGVAADYELFATYEIPVKLADKDVHKLIQTLNPSLRYNPSKEFFMMNPRDALKIFEVFANVHNRKLYLVKYENGRPIKNSSISDNEDICNQINNDNYEKKNELFYCKGKDAFARGSLQNNRIVILKGSRISSTTSASLGKNYVDIRNGLIANGTIKDYSFTKDVEMNASRASRIILGRSSSGNVDWKTESGINLGEYLKNNMK